MSMKNLITSALNDAMIKLVDQVPLTKKEMMSISIIDVSPLDLVNFMKDNNIPDDAEFGGRDNGYDAWDDICLEWTIDVPTTDDDRLKFKRNRFSGVAFRFVYDTLIDNGYERTGYNSGLLKDFDDTTVYDMYMAQDFDRLVKYYSLPFKKI